MQIHGVSEPVAHIDVERWGTTGVALRFPGTQLVVQNHADVDRLMIAAAKARELLPPESPTVHLLRADLSIACPLDDDAALCSSVITEVTCSPCLATFLDPGLCNLGGCQREAGHSPPCTPALDRTDAVVTPLRPVTS